MLAALSPATSAAPPPVVTVPEIRVAASSCIGCHLSLFAVACAPAPGEMVLVFKGYSFSPTSEPRAWTVPLAPTADPACAYRARYEREGPIHDELGFDIMCGVLAGAIAGAADVSESCLVPV